TTSLLTSRPASRAACGRPPAGSATAAAGGLAISLAPESGPVRSDVRCAVLRCLVKGCGRHRAESPEGPARALLRLACRLEGVPQNVLRTPAPEHHSLDAGVAVVQAAPQPRL